MVNRREYFRHFMTLLSGTALAQVFNLASYPILGRLYDPIAFGVFAVFVAIAAVPVAVACGRFDLAVPIARPGQALAVFWLCVLIAVGAGVLSTGGLLGYALAVGGVPLIMVPLIGLAVTLGGVSACSSLLLLRHDGYRLTSTAVIARTLAGNGVQIGLGLIAPTGQNLIIGYVLGVAVQCALLLWGLRRIIHWRVPRRSRLRAAFARFRPQVAIDVPSTLIGATAINLLTWFLLVLFGPVAVGFYAMANRLAITPLALFNDTLSQVFFQKASRAERERGGFWPELKLNLLSSSVIAVAILGGILLLARPFIAVFLGEKWLPSADVLILIAPLLAVRSVGVSIATAVFVLRRPQWLLFLNIANAVAYTAVFLSALGFAMGERTYLLTTSLAVSVVYAVFILGIARAARRAQS